MRRNRSNSIDAETEKDQCPIPVAITLRNLYIPKDKAYTLPGYSSSRGSLDGSDDDHELQEEEEDEFLYHSNRWTNHLPLHKALVVPVELEIVVPYKIIHYLNQTLKTKSTKKILKKLFGKYDVLKGTTVVGHNDDQDVLILCSKIIERPCSHLLWDHLEDKLDDLYASIPVSTSDTEEDILARTNIWNEVKMSMKIRCKAHIPSPTLNKTSRRKSVEYDMECEKHKFNMHSIVLAMIDLDVSQLKILPQNTQTSNAFVLPSSKYCLSVPSALPSNAFLIHFSDGTTRTSIETYNLLIDQKIITGDTTNRFDDKVFNMLEEQVEYTKARLSMNGSSMTTRKKIIQKGNSIHGDTALKRDTNEITPSKRANRGAFVDAFESVSISAHSSRNSSIHGNPIVSVDDGIPDPLDSSDSSSTSDCSDEIDLSKLKEIESGEIQDQNIDNEIQRLNDILKYNQQKVEDELRLQKKLTMNLGDLTNKIDDLERNVSLIKQYSKSVFEQNTSLEGILYKRKDRLIQDLKLLYPIQSLPDGMYTIRGIPLPIDMHSLVASEEIISAGLGFVSHLVTMCSKYLEIPLRYRLICNSSRSAVRDDNFDVYPLFKERVIEKDQFDRGMVLLHRNIDHLLDLRNIPPQIRSKHPHILSKLLLIFE